jgi:hypothetical protein
VVQQVEPLSQLLEARNKLADLRNKLAGNDKLEDILNDVLNNTDKLASLNPGGTDMSAQLNRKQRSRGAGGRRSCWTRSSSRARSPSPAWSMSAPRTSSRSW